MDQGGSGDFKTIQEAFLGPGSDPKARVSWSHQLTPEQASTYTAQEILKGEGGWNPVNELKY